ncbi:MAG: hypothetical protein Q4G46_02730 [Propionibacteriaceae bacterium]|nr:hypothetical protein [Propionibacteriaceae bacterium]
MASNRDHGSSGGTLVTSTAEQSVLMGLPEGVDVRGPVEAADGTLFFGSSRRATDVAVQVIDDGSVRMHTIIPDADSPRQYVYPLTIPNGSKIGLLESGDVIISGSGGEFIAGISKPWAVDADGVNLPTKFRIEGNKVIQEIDFSRDTKFPVVADPWLGRALYKRVYVSTSSRGYVVNATPSAWGLAWNGRVTYDAHRDEVRNKTPRDRYGRSRYTSTIFEQHMCHLIGFPLSLPEYNLESWRPTVPAAISLARHQCNPR